MNEVKKTLVESKVLMEDSVYVSPKASVVTFQSEGVLCTSGNTQTFNEQDFSDGSFWN